jgi:hypothetical protein
MFTQAQLDAIDAGIAFSALTVRYEGKSTTFRSLDDMLRIRSLIAAALGMVGQSRTLIAAHYRGYKGPLYGPDQTSGLYLAAWNWGGM